MIPAGGNPTFALQFFCKGLKGHPFVDPPLAVIQLWDYHYSADKGGIRKWIPLSKRALLGQGLQQDLSEEVVLSREPAFSKESSPKSVVAARPLRSSSGSGTSLLKEKPPMPRVQQDLQKMFFSQEVLKQKPTSY